MPDVALPAFSYGDVELSHITTQYKTEPHTDPSGVDVIGIKHRITVSGLLVGSYTAPRPPGIPADSPVRSAETPAAELARVRNILVKPRQKLIYAPNGEIVVSIPEGGDIANGPKCSGISTTMIAEGCIGVDVTVECITLVCPEGQEGSQGKPKAVLSSRFSQSLDFDRCGWSTITTSGVIIVRTDLERSPLEELLIEAGVGRTRAGFQQIEPTNYQWAKDGSSLTFVRTEKEYYASPFVLGPTRQEEINAGNSNPYKSRIMEFSGDITVVQGPSNQSAYLSISINGKAHVETSKGELLDRLNLIAHETIKNLRRREKSGFVPLREIRLATNLYENKAEIMLRVLATPGILTDQLSLLAVLPFGSIESRKSSNDKQNRRPGFEPVVVLEDIAVSDQSDPCEGVESTLPPRRPLPVGNVPGDPKILSQPIGDIIGSSTTPNPRTPRTTPSGSGFTTPLGSTSSGGSSGDNLTANDLIPNVGITLGGRGQQLRDVSAPSAGVRNAGAVVDRLFANAFGGNPVGSEAASVAGRLEADIADSSIPYTIYKLSMRIQHSSGRKVIPTQNYDQSGKKYPDPIARIHGGETLVIITWSASRIGEAPIIPDPQPPETPAGRNWVLHSLEYGLDQVEQSGGPQLAFTRDGVYRYQLRASDDATLFDLVPPMLLADVDAEYPQGLPTATEGPRFSKDLIWGQMRKVRPVRGMFGARV